MGRNKQNKETGTYRELGNTREKKTKREKQGKTGKNKTNLERAGQSVKLGYITRQKLKILRKTKRLRHNKKD